MSKEGLLKIVYADKNAYIAEVGLTEYECLVDLVKSGYIKTIEQLAEYGVTIPDND